jgi:amino acid adenylation domain-containing protein
MAQRIATRSKLSCQLLEAASAFSASPAVEIDQRGYSYEQLWAAAGGIARRLVEHGAAGDRCAVLGRRSFSAYAAFVACLLAEHIYLPLSPRDPAARHGAMLGRGRVEALVTDRASLAYAAMAAKGHGGLRLFMAPDVRRGELAALDLPSGTCVLGAEDLIPTLEFPKPTYVDPEGEAAYLIFTSGSTGTPKGVLVPASAVNSYLSSIGPILGISPEDRVSQVFDPGFDLSLHDMLTCWRAGACLTPIPSARQFRPGDAIRDLGMSVWFSVPSAIAVMAGLGQLRPENLAGLRLSLFCGEALAMRDAEMWRRANPAGRILNLYGPTEATIATSVHEVTSDDLDHTTAPIGRPLGGVSYFLIDPERRVRTGGSEGELAIAGDQLAIGYWDDPNLTEARFRSNFQSMKTRIYLTGDRVRRLQPDNYSFLGRLDTEIKIGGYRLNLLEAEAAIIAASGAQACIVVASPNRAGALTHLTAFVVGGELDDLAIRERLRETQPSYMAPDRILHLSELPLLSNGKVDRRALAEMSERENVLAIESCAGE